jgi:Concanavalin A-like lectin/glucanases superfamily
MFLKRTLLSLAIALSVTIEDVAVSASNELFATPTPLERYNLRSCDGAYSPPEIPSLTEPWHSVMGALLLPQAQSYLCDDGSYWAYHALTDRLMETNGSLVEFQQEFTNVGGLSIAVWVTTTFNGYTEPILTLGQRRRDQSELDPSGFTSSPQQGCPGYHFRLQQTADFFLRQGHNFVVSFTDSALNCQTVMLNQELNAQQLYHFVISFGESSTDVYVNGLPVLPTTFEELFLTNTTTDVRIWPDAASSTLQLFANYVEENIFTGRMHQVDLFQDALTADQVATLYVRGPGNRLDLNLKETEPPVVVVEVDPYADEATYNPWYNDTDRSDIIAKALVIPQAYGHTLYVELPLDRPSTASVPLGIEIMALHHAFEKGNQSLAEVHEVLAVGENETGVTILYFPFATISHFNSPKFNAYGTPLNGRNESIAFRTVRIGTKYASRTTVIPIERPHINHGVPTLTVPATSTLNEMDPLQSTVRGITVEDHPLDFNINHVRVDVWSNGGTISLNPLYLHLADFSCPNQTQIVSEDAETEESWQCMGDGHENQRMTFVAIPDDVTLILDTLRHTTLREFAGQASELVIRIFDGVDGQCLTDVEHRSYFPYASAYYPKSAPVQCLMQCATVRVPSYDISNHGNGTENEDPLETMDPATPDPTTEESTDNNTATDSPQSEEPAGDDPDTDKKETDENNENDERVILGMKWQEFVSVLGGLALTVVVTAVWCIYCFQMPPWLERRWNSNKVTSTHEKSVAGPKLETIDDV